MTCTKWLRGTVMQEHIPKKYGPDEYAFLSRDVEYDLEKFKDPYVVGAMIHRLVEERKLTNALFRSIDKKLEELVEISRQMRDSIREGSAGKEEIEAFLSDVDKEILKYVKLKKKVCAEEVQKKFKYKGKNAASARLNQLAKEGLLKKKRAGKRVIYYI